MFTEPASQLFLKLALISLRTIGWSWTWHSTGSDFCALALHVCNKMPGFGHLLRCQKQWLQPCDLPDDLAQCETMKAGVDTLWLLLTIPRERVSPSHSLNQNIVTLSLEKPWAGDIALWISTSLASTRSSAWFLVQKKSIHLKFTEKLYRALHDLVESNKRKCCHGWHKTIVIKPHDSYFYCSLLYCLLTQLLSPLLYTICSNNN